MSVWIKFSILWYKKQKMQELNRCDSPAFATALTVNAKSTFNKQVVTGKQTDTVSHIYNECKGECFATRDLFSKDNDWERNKEIISWECSSGVSSLMNPQRWPILCGVVRIIKQQGKSKTIATLRVFENSNC